MAFGFDNDPHSQNGSACPRNFFGITEYAELKKREAIHVPKRALELRIRGLAGKFDLRHLRKIHWYLFRDVFPWAGELRLVTMSKVGGAPFAFPQFIEPTLTDLFGNLKRESYLRDRTEENFVERAAYYLGEINAVHPFREGNGRTQREFLRLLALAAGYRLSWAELSEQENIAASVLSHVRGDHSGLAAILRRSIAGKVEEK
jgi:cell filamentation protein